MREIFIFLFACICLLACREKDKGETVTVAKGLEVPIAACVEANGKIFGKSVDPKILCRCLLPKFYEDVKNNPAKLKLLKDGKWHEINVDELNASNQYFQDCLVEAATGDSTAKFTMTPRMAEGMKKGMKQRLVGSEVEITNDVDKYCDCLISSLKTDFTVKEIMQDNFNETEKYMKVAEKCLASTRKIQ